MTPEERQHFPVGAGGRGYSIETLSDSSRALTLGTLVFLANLVLGSRYLPTEFYFWVIGISRLVLALGLTVLPRTSMGKFRPLLITVGLLALTPVAPSWGALLLFYLLLEVTVDTLTIEQSTEQDVPFQLGVLAALRTGGLWIGLLLQTSGQHISFESERLPAVALLAIILFWTAVRERRSDSYLSTEFEPQSEPGSRVLKESVREVAKKWSLYSLANLGAVALVAGSVVGGVLPYPLLHPDGATLWLDQTLLTLKVLLAGLVWAYLLEKLGLSAQLLLGSAGVIIYLTLPWLGKGPQQPVALGLLFFSILVCCKAVLRETFRASPCLRSSLIVTLWIVGCLGGEYLRRFSSSEALPVLRFALGAFSCIFAITAYRRFGSRAEEIVAPPPRSERFGDRKLDFEAAPQLKPRKKFRFLSSLSILLLVNLPVKLFLAVAVSVTVLAANHLWVERKTVREQVESSVKVLHTKLLLSAFERRLNEEMLASRRVPTDWKQFMVTNFHGSGKPIDDRDPWGTPLRFQNSKTEVSAVSAGPDKRFDTPDDLEQIIKKPQGVK